MTLNNFHTHTHFSDGSAAPLEYIKEAVKQGISTLGFSDHSPLPFENSFALREERVKEYCETILSLKTQLNHQSDSTSRLSIVLGLEADYIPRSGYPFAHFQENYPLDFLIGSVHLVRNGSPDDLWFIDGPDPSTYSEGLKSYFGNDIRRGVTAYYRQINEMLELNKMDIIGHLDKIKMHNRGRFFHEEELWYHDLVDETLNLVKERDVIVEVNTRGLYKKRCNSLFPSVEILRKIRRMNIPVVISSDAHKPTEISMLFDETSRMLFDIGFRATMTLSEKGWHETALEL